MVPGLFAFMPGGDMDKTETRYLDSQVGRVVAEWEPLTNRATTWRARTFVQGDNTTVTETEHVGREPRLAAKRAALRRMNNIAAGINQKGRGWGGQRSQHAPKTTPTVVMRARIPVDLAARLIAEAKDAGISEAMYLGRILQEARP
jgi:hypothetical protein